MTQGHRETAWSVSPARAAAARQRVEKDLVSGRPGGSTLRCMFRAQGCSEAPSSPCSEAPVEAAVARRGRASLCKLTLYCALPCWQPDRPLPSPPPRTLSPAAFSSCLPAFETPGPLPPSSSSSSSSSWAFSPSSSAQNKPSVVPVNSLQASVPWPLDGCCSPQPAPASPTTAGPGLGPGLECRPA